MVKKILCCLREYRTATIATIILTALETLLEIIVHFSRPASSIRAFTRETGKCSYPPPGL